MAAKPGRKAIELDREEFQKNISEFEQKNNFTTRAALWAAFADTEWARTRKPRALTPQVAMLFAEKNGVVICTEKGSKGRKKGEKVQVRRSLPVLAQKELLDDIPKSLRAKLSPLVDKVCKGSLKAAIKLKCLSCTNFDSTEIRLCNITGCPLWHHRPYKA